MRKVASVDLKAIDRMPFLMTNLKTLVGVDEVVRFIETKGLLKHGAHAAATAPGATTP